MARLECIYKCKNVQEAWLSRRQSEVLIRYFTSKFVLSDMGLFEIELDCK